MSWMELIHDLLMVVFIAMGAIACSVLIVRAIGDERRHNANFAVKLIATVSDKLVDSFKEIVKTEKNVTEKKQEEIRKEIDDLWKM